MAGQGSGAARGRRPRAHRRGMYWSAVLASLVLMAAGSVVAYLGYSAVAGPGGVVTAYFAALQRGDAASALAFGAVPPGTRPLLTDRVLREQQRLAPITGVQVLSVRHAAARRATVTVHYDIAYPDDPKQVIDQVPVLKRGSTWYLARVAIPTQIELTHAVERASIVGAGIPSAPTLLFPGAVPIRLDTPLLQISGGEVTFATGDKLAVPVALTKAGRDAVIDALNAALGPCVKSGGRGHCPLPSDRYVPGSLAGRLSGDVADSVELSVDPAAAGVIDVVGSIVFRGRYRMLRFDNTASTKYGSIRIPLTAKAFALKPIVIQWAGAQ